MDESTTEQLIDIQNTKKKRFLVISISLFLITLILSYFLISYPIYPILESLFESKTIDNNRIILDNNTSLTFINNTYNILKNLYYENQSVEFVSCLLGSKNGKEYKINYLIIPSIIDQSFNHVQFEKCPPDTLAIIHSHPFRRCIASEQDLVTLEELKERNHDILMVIMCEPGRFTIYGN